MHPQGYLAKQVLLGEPARSDIVDICLARYAFIFYIRYLDWAGNYPGPENMAGKRWKILTVSKRTISKNLQLTKEKNG